MNTVLQRPRLAIALAALAIVFGAVTLYSGGTVLFADGQARSAAGNYVPFLLWLNFLAGFVYIAAGVGFYMWRPWAGNLSALIAIATVLVFGAFGLHIVLGGAYELRTVGAMVLRSAIWLGIAAYSRPRLARMI